MHDDIDVEDKVIAMQRGGKFSIQEMLAQTIEAAKPNGEPPTTKAEVEPVAEPPPLDDVSPLPNPSDPYKAYARVSNKPVPTLVLLLADASKKGFSYANLDTIDMVASADPGQGPAIALRFTGLAATEILLSGRNLDLLYNYIGFHRMAWIRERPPSRDFLAAEDTVITGVKISKVEG